jgi:pyrroline-5-carboxylate reductase
MENRSISFIGGGRITKIFLTAFETSKISFKKISVMDVNREVLSALSARFSNINVVDTINDDILNADYVFLAVHPPVIAETLGKVKGAIGANSILISLAPKFTIDKITTLLGDFNRVVRLLPLASSIMGKGYNPVAFAPSIANESMQTLLNLFGTFGQTIEVAESKIEPYAMIVAMGPTYLWFQYYKLIELAKSFGMDELEAIDAVRYMLDATSDTMFTSGLTKEQVFDLIPVKPIGEHEQEILRIYDEKLNGLFQKIKP